MNDSVDPEFEGKQAKDDPPVQERAGGFGYSARQVWLEVAAIALGLALCAGVVIWAAGKTAELLTDFVPIEVDRAIGRDAWSLAGASDQVCPNADAQVFVERIADRLRPQFGHDFKFQFRVVDDEQINAFALPGGFVTVNIGLLKNASSGEEVAGVLGHEMAHVTGRHGTRRILRQLGGLAVLSLIFGGTDFEQALGLASGLANGAYDRAQEVSADSVGREALMAAGISPLGMAEFFERLEGSADLTPPEFLSSHPDPGRRAATAREQARGFNATVALPSPLGIRCR